MSSFNSNITKTGLYAHNVSLLHWAGHEYNLQTANMQRNYLQLLFKCDRMQMDLSSSINW